MSSFRPLIGVIISNIEKIHEHEFYNVCFRPLIGVIISNKKISAPVCQEYSFRPLIGVIISNPIAPHVTRLCEGFRPLIGVIISNPSSSASIIVSSSSLFPSPYRGYHF